MKTISFFFLSICLAFTLLATGCSKQNDALVAQVVTGIQGDTATYPHNVTWKNQHMDFMAQKKAPEATCLQCHNSPSSLGAPLKVSCATTCHQTTGDNLPPKPTPNPVENKCSKCHSDVTENNFGHYPATAGLCATCHTVTEKHLKGDGSKAETKNTAMDCYRCHTKKDNEPVVHGALKSKTSCISCHNPHGGNQRYFIADESIQNLCLGCHTKTKVNTMSKHGPSIDQKSCINCHNPHSSKNKKLLLAPQKELCLSCHNRPIEAKLNNDPRVIPDIKSRIEAASLHTGANGNCTSCHNAHGSDNKRILKLNYSVSNYNSYPGTGKDPYALCFSCHDAGMLNKDDVTATGFSDANKNHHYGHVVDANGNTDKSQGKSCSICHDPHGSSQAFNINESWLMNGQTIGIKYTKTNNGGSCTFTCHDLRSYTRP